MHAYGLAPAHAQSGDIYRATEADGTVMFTDRPVPDATLIEPGSPNVVDSGRTASPSEDGSSGETGETGDRFDDGPADASAEGSMSGTTAAPPPRRVTRDSLAGGTGGRDAMADVPIQRVEIASPPPDATLIDPVGALLVEVGTAPGSLAATELIAEAVVDGQVVASGASSIAVPPLDRGEHSLAVRLVDAAGRVIVESAPQMLYVRRGFVREPDEDGS